MRATYVPEWTVAPLFVRPSHMTLAGPACCVTAGSAFRITVPESVSIRVVTDAARASSNCATALVRRRGTDRAGATAIPNPSVVLSENGRSTDDTWPRSSVALTTHRQRPSGSRAPSAPRPFHSKAHVLGDAWPAKTGRVVLSGATRGALTVEGRTTLYASSCNSATSSPFGEMTETPGSGAWTPAYTMSNASETGRSAPEGRLSSWPSKAIVEEPPPSSAAPAIAP